MDEQTISRNCCKNGLNVLPIHGDSVGSVVRPTAEDLLRN
jgi:hypothetical protein